MTAEELKVSAAEPVLRVGELSKAFGGVSAVDDVSFEARRGLITAMIGPNGAGKTTVFNLVTNILQPIGARSDFRAGIWPECRRST
jgi:branched-chain amino acid transport system ATP-binding protein